MTQPIRSEENCDITDEENSKSRIFEGLVRRYSDRIFLIILRLVQSPGTAEDLLQDTWVLVLRKFHQYDAARPVFPWLAKIAVNRCRSYWRKKRVAGILRSLEQPGGEAYLKDHQPGPITKMEHREAAARILKKLSPKLREVVVLKFYGDMSQNEISEVLGIPSGTVKSRLNYALLKMRSDVNRGGKP